MYCFLLGIVAFFYLISFPVAAIEKSPSVFYPLPTHAEGKVYAAKSLFLGDEGGVWIHDIHGKVRFFDGQNVLPGQGSLLAENYKQLTYLNNNFWGVIDGALQKISPGNVRQKVIDLPIGTLVDKVGVSGKNIWLVSKEYFYTYNTESELLETFSLENLSHFDRTKSIVVNDATFGISKWVLATSSGVFLSENQGFEHVPRSGNDYVETLFFSKKRREMLIGTLDGVLIIDLKNRAKEPNKIAKSHVLSITETENEYWVGTENGLFVYSLLTGTTTKLKSNVHSEYSLKGQKIFSIVNDFQEGIWIASEKGVFYYSKFGQKFNRFVPKQITLNTFSRAVNTLSSLSADSYLLSTVRGVYLLDLSKALKKRPIVTLPVNDSVSVNGYLWLATDNGLMKYHIDSNRFVPSTLPVLLNHSKIEQIEIDDKGNLWGTSGIRLWSFNPESGRFYDYGEEWVVDAYLPATVTQLKSTKNNGIIIGTEHGTYSVTQQKVAFNSASYEYGQSHHMIEDSQTNVWFAADYGIYKFNPSDNQIQPISMAEDSISPKCLMETPQGIWLSSSRGITLYGLDGEIKKHFGEPYGLINNEFLPGVCTSDVSSDNPQLVIGSSLGLIKVSAEELSVSSLPKSATIISQIKVDDQLIAIGNPFDFKFEYGRALRLVFGSLPQTIHSAIEYRLNSSDIWKPVDGAQLTLDHLHPGAYKLYLRHSNSTQEDGIETNLTFRVTEPWYLTPVAMFFYVCSLVLIILMAVWWRSRLMTKANRLLKEQVDLKTSQLSHQSKIVLSNNLQLRKQIQVRHALLENILSTIEPRLEKLSYGASKTQQTDLERLAIEARRDLQQVKNIRCDSEDRILIHNLSVVLESAINSWQNEFLVAAVSIEMDIPCRNTFIELKQFNLDVVFNTLLSEAIKRLYKNQTLYVKCYQLEQRIVVLMSDQGVSAKNIAQTMATTSGFALNQLNDLVTQSGGELNTFVSDEQNVVQLSWPCANPEKLSDTIEDYAKYTDETIFDDSECRWFNKIEQLVIDNYSDAEFSTTTVIKTLFMSERSFQRRFKSSTGKTFKEYLNQIRLEKACQRLLSGERVSQVAYECGFNDPSYFSQRFKHYFGLSPTQFVDEHQD